MEIFKFSILPDPDSFEKKTKYFFISSYFVNLVHIISIWVKSDLNLLKVVFDDVPRCTKQWNLIRINKNILKINHCEEYYIK